MTYTISRRYFNKLSLLACVFIGWLLNYRPTNAQTSSFVNSRGSIIYQERPFFPVGFYCWDLEAIEIVSKHRFNYVNLVNEVNQNFLDMLDKTEELGIPTVISAPFPHDLHNFMIAQFKSRSNLLGWNIGDDADDGEGKYPNGVAKSLAFFRDVQSKVKKADPRHITLLSLTGYFQTRRSLGAEFIAISDVCEYQSYSIAPLDVSDWGNPDRVLTETYQRILAYVKEAERQGKPLINVGQVFSWASYASDKLPHRFPTVSEFRNMAYGSLAAGVKGLVGYEFDYKRNLYNDNRELFNEFVAINADIKNTLQDFLLEGKLTRFDTGDDELIASHWQQNGELLIVVVNTSYHSEKNFRLSLPLGKSKFAQAVSRTAATLTFDDEVVIGSLPAQAVAVYKTTER